MHHAQMGLQLPHPSKSCATLHAYVGLITAVFSLVYGQSPTASEALATLRAFKPPVYFSMLVQSSFVFKCSTAEAAGKWPFFTV